MNANTARNGSHSSKLCAIISFCTPVKSASNATSATLHSVKLAIYKVRTGFLWAFELLLFLICGFNFFGFLSFLGHKLVHSGIKPHSCMECGKLFALRGNLTVHMRTHDGSKPYHCKICTKGFSDSNSLKRHHLRHQRKSQTNPISSAEQIDEVTTETPTEFSNIEAPTVQSTIMQLPSTAAPMGAKVAQWAMDQNAAFHMSTVEPTFADDSTYQAVSVPLQLNLAPAQTINDANKIIFKAD